jgi:two-component system, chemotaxis family, chemotaxis protein CheY
MRALVIDDSISMRMYIAAMIEGMGAEVCMAQDGQDALRLLREQGAFDFATVDWDMPVMDGPSFVKAVRSDARYNPMKLVMVTAREGMDEITKALTLGADDFLMKPVTADMIAEKLRLVGVAS